MLKSIQTLPSKYHINRPYEVLVAQNHSFNLEEVILKVI